MNNWNEGEFIIKLYQIEYPFYWVWTVITKKSFQKSTSCTHGLKRNIHFPIKHELLKQMNPFKVDFQTPIFFPSPPWSLRRPMVGRSTSKERKWRKPSNICQLQDCQNLLLGWRIYRCNKKTKCFCVFHQEFRNLKIIRVSITN